MGTRKKVGFLGVMGGLFIQSDLNLARQIESRGASLREVNMFPCVPEYSFTSFTDHFGTALALKWSAASWAGPANGQPLGSKHLDLRIRPRHGQTPFITFRNAGLRSVPPRRL